MSGPSLQQRWHDSPMFLSSRTDSHAHICRSHFSLTSCHQHMLVPITAQGKVPRQSHCSACFASTWSQDTSVSFGLILQSRRRILLLLRRFIFHLSWHLVFLLEQQALEQTPDHFISIIFTDSEQIDPDRGHAQAREEQITIFCCCRLPLIDVRLQLVQI